MNTKQLLAALAIFATVSAALTGIASLSETASGQNVTGGNATTAGGNVTGGNATTAATVGPVTSEGGGEEDEYEK